MDTREHTCTHTHTHTHAHTHARTHTYTHILYNGKVQQIDSNRGFGKRKFGELIDWPIGY